MATMSMESRVALPDPFYSLVREHERLLHKVCHLYCHSEEERRDLLQEILLQLWKSLPAYEGRAKPSTWVYRVAINTAITFLRKSARTGRTDAALGSLPTASEEAEFRRVENIEILNRALATLSAVERAAVLLHFEEKSYQEIGEILGISEKAVSVKLVRITNKLRLWYQDVCEKGGGHGTR